MAGAVVTGGPLVVLPDNRVEVAVPEEGVMTVKTDPEVEGAESVIVVLDMTIMLNDDVDIVTPDCVAPLVVVVNVDLDDPLELLAV